MYSRIKQLNRFTDMIQIRPSQLSDLDRLMEI
ncbi:GNAT family N-acetyltransferase, partial [Bacteroides cellulosilyticus]